MFAFFPEPVWDRLQEMRDRRQTGRVVVFVKDGIVLSCEVAETFRTPNHPAASSPPSDQVIDPNGSASVHYG